MSKTREIATTTIDGKAETERLIRIDELAAGQYWRSIKKIPGKNWTHRSSKGGRTRSDGRDALAAGVTLLVTSLRHVDGELHTIILAPHPTEAKEIEERRFLRDEFFQLFEREMDPAAVRSSEIAGVEAGIRQVQQELIEGPKDLPKLNPNAAMPTMNALIANADRAAEIRKGAERSVALSQERAKWVQTKVEDLAASTELLAFYHKEQATAALAQVEDTIRYVKHLDAGIQTLGLYTGDGVVVSQLTKGEDAPSSEPLSLYQRKLYMDEEWAVYLADGGADHNDLEEFAETLAKDQALVDRLLPMPRSVVVMRYRRNDKEYFGPDDARNAIARALANDMANEPNRRTFLLVRNGGNVYQIFSEATTDKAIRLFPTSEEVETLYRKGSGFFRGMDAEEIKTDDLMYTDAREDHDNVALFYKRMLVLLWGLNDRLGLFGVFYDRARFSSWLGQDFQQTHFNFIYDDEGALIDGRPDYSKYIEAANQHVQAGSRIVCQWQRIMDPASAPGATEWERNKHGDKVKFRYSPDERIGFDVVRKKGADLTVSVACHYSGWREVARKNADMTVSVTAALKGSSNWQPGILCLDALKAADLDYYINSRRQREQYANYLDLFVAARNRLRIEEAEAAPFVAAVRAALDAAGIAGKVKATKDETTDQRIQGAIDEAIRLWRANRFGRKVPTPRDKDWKDALNQIGQQIYRLLGLEGDRTEQAEKALAADGRSMLRLISAGSGKLYAYATPKAEEAFDTAGPFPWVARIEVKVGRKGVSLGEPAMTVLPEKDPSEHVLKECLAGTAWLEARPKTTTLDYADVKGLIAFMQDQKALLELVGDKKPMPDPTFNAWMTGLVVRTRALSSRGYVTEPKIMVPVTAFEAKDENGTQTQIICVEAKLSEILWARGSEAQRATINAKFLHGTYAKPTVIRERIVDAMEGNRWLGISTIGVKSAVTKLDLSQALVMCGDDESGYHIKRPATLAGLGASLKKHFVERGSRNRDMVMRKLDWTKAGDEALNHILRTWPRPKDDEPKDDEAKDGGEE